MSLNLDLEDHRLRTFQSWPSNAPVDPERLARGGFFATGCLLDTECNFCHKRITDWNYGDQIMARHRLLDPLCPFVLLPTRSGNVPNLPTLSSGSFQELSDALASTHQIPQQDNSMLSPVQQPVQPLQLQQQSQNNDFKNEWQRLDTFKNWPNPNVTPQALAKAGFYYLNEGDKVKCAWCRGVVAKWEPGDDAFEEHKRIFPFCPRVQLGPLIEIASDGIRDLGIQKIRAPNQPKYSSLDARLRTYAQWPRSDIQKPEILAQAGLYYQNIEDQVRCFHCNGGLRCWQKEDDPWFEHAKWFPKCQFVRLVKGPRYVQEVQKSKKYKTENTIDTTSPRIDPRIWEEQQERSLNEAMHTEPVQHALQLGLHERRIRCATKRRLESTGQPYETPEELIDAVLEGQSDEEDTPGTELSFNISQEVSRILSTIFNTNDEAIGGTDIDFDDNVTPTETTAQSPGQDTTGTFSLFGVDSDLFYPEPSTPNFDSPTIGWNVAAPASTPASTSEHQPMEEATASSSSSTSDLEKHLQLEEENRKLKDARLCKVCMDDDVGVVFLPCGHLVTCVQCAPGVTMCPLCRSPIKGFVRTFLS